MKNFLSLLFFALVAVVLMAPSTQAGSKTFKDKGWSVRFFENCVLPVTSGRDRSVAWVKVGGDKNLRFILRKGEKGGCPNDSQARHRAPYWERAELRQDGYLKIGGVYRILFEATFLQGFSGERETFFQIHGNFKACHASPPVMLKMDDGKLSVMALHRVSGNGLNGGSGQHRPVQSGTFRVGDLYGKPLKFSIDVDFRQNPARLSIVMNGRRIVNNAAVEYAPCAKPYLKMGVYRPGGKGAGTSSVVFDDIQLVEVK